MLFEDRVHRLQDEFKADGKLVSAPTVEQLVETLPFNPWAETMTADAFQLMRRVPPDQNGWRKIFEDLGHAPTSVLSSHTERLCEIVDALGIDEIPCPVTTIIQGYMTTFPPPHTAPVEKQGSLLPSMLAQNDNDSRYGMRCSIDGSFVLPGLHARGIERRQGGILPIELFRINQSLVDKGGPAAPLAQRLFVVALALAPLDIPSSGIVFERAATAVFQMLYPVGQRRHKRWLMLLWDCLEQLDKYGWMPFISPDTGRKSMLRPVTINLSPMQSVMDPVAFLVRLPSSQSGPIVSPRLLEYGQNRRQAFNAMLQLAYHWHAPGRTVIKSRGGRWTRAYAWDRYEPYGRDDIIHLTAPITTRRNRRRAYADGMATLMWLVEQGEIDIIEVGRHEHKIRPKSPARLIEIE